MYGAIIGDIAGSRFEFNNWKRKDFQLLHPHCRLTDDSVMTLAVAYAIMKHRDGEFSTLEEAAVHSMQAMGRRYPHAGYGGRFIGWLMAEDPRPYESYGNGAAMRVSPCAQAASSLEEALAMSEAVTAVSHNHPEGIKGAAATTAAIFLARSGATLEAIRAHFLENYYPIDFTLDGIRRRIEDWE